MLRANGLILAQLAALVPRPGRAACPEVLPPGSSIPDKVCPWYACHYRASGHTQGHLPVVIKPPLVGKQRNKRCQRLGKLGKSLFTNRINDTI